MPGEPTADEAVHVKGALSDEPTAETAPSNASRANTQQTVLTWVSVLLAVVSVAGVFGERFLKALRYSADPGFFNDDARAFIFPFDHFVDRALFPNDFLGQYMMACCPTGFRVFYAGLAPWFDPQAVSKVLPTLELAVVIAALAIASAKFGKVASAWATVCLCLSSPVFQDRIVGGLPRSFGFPVVACTLAALVHGRMLALAVITVVGAAFYPVAGIPGGIALVLCLFALPARDRGDASAWTTRRRLLTVGATVIGAALMIGPTLLATQRYGGYIREADLVTYPEGGPSGRFYAGDRPPYDSLDVALQKTIVSWTARHGDSQRRSTAWADARHTSVIGILGVALVAIGWAARRDAPARRLLLLLAAMLAGFGMATLVPPFLYLPTRYILYTLPVVLCVGIPAGIVSMARTVGVRAAPYLQAAGLVACGLLAISPVGPRWDARTGFTVHEDPKKGIFPFIASLPKDALIAGWPEELDSVPYVSRRQAFVTFETHQAFHKGFVTTIRKRMRALIDAYFTADAARLVALRDEFGVTHLLVNLQHYESMPHYFEPFGAWTRSVFGKNRHNFVVPRLLDRAAVFRDDEHVILDLSKLPPGAPPVAP